jgi:hypothetical protein
MPIKFRNNSAALTGVCAVEEAETLLSWLGSHPKAKIRIDKCEHLHAAVWQVLMAARIPLSGTASDPVLADWILPALSD